MPLTLKQKLFVAHYLGTSQGNATDAARRAGYRTPTEQGYENLRKPQIQAAIAGKVAALVMPQEEILIRLGEIAGADLLDFVTGNTSVDININLKMARRKGKGFLLKRIKTAKGELDIELKDSLAAITLIGKYYGMWDRDAPPEISLVELAKRLAERAKDRAKAKESPKP